MFFLYRLLHDGTALYIGVGLGLLTIILQTTPESVGIDPSLFDPATTKLGGMSILTIHMGIMAQLKRFFVVGRHKKFFDILNYPLAFVLVVPLLPPWPIYSFPAWANYVGGAVGLAVLASVTAQKVISASEDVAEKAEEIKAEKADEPRRPRLPE